MRPGGLRTQRDSLAQLDIAENVQSLYRTRIVLRNDSYRMDLQQGGKV
jgi:hypothetical protein